MTCYCTEYSRLQLLLQSAFSCVYRTPSLSFADSSLIYSNISGGGTIALETNGPLFMLFSRPIQNYLENASSNRGQRLSTSIKMEAEHVVVSVRDPRVMNLDSFECRYNHTIGSLATVPGNTTVMDGNAFDHCLVASAQSILFKGKFAYNTNRETIYQDQYTNSTVLVLCPQPPFDERNYATLVSAGVVEGQLRQIKVGLSMETVNCRNAHQSFAL
jgi:hypothetical protein